MITDIEIIKAVIESIEGGAVADQFKALDDGESLDDQNPNSLRIIVPILRKIALRNDNLGHCASEYANQIADYLTYNEG